MKTINSKNIFEVSQDFLQAEPMEITDADLLAIAGAARPWSGGHTCSPTDNCI